MKSLRSRGRRRLAAGDLDQVIEGAAEVALVGQHADRGGPIVGVGARQAQRVEIRREQAARGRGAFDLRDQRRAEPPAAQGRHEVEWRRRPRGTRLHDRQWDRLLAGSHLFLRVREDLVQDGHCRTGRVLRRQP